MDNLDIAPKPDVLDMKEVQDIIKPLQGHDRLTRRLMKFFALDKVNWLHSRNYRNGGGDAGAISEGMLRDLNVRLEIRGRDVLDNLPEGPFITVSNHPFGAMEGIMLLNLIATRRPKFKVMVNMILKHISGFGANFIAVDALASDDPKKKAVSMRGIKEAFAQIRSGEPLGFFPAGAVSKINGRLRIEDRQWQPNVMRIIAQCKVPVIPIYFHGHNSVWFNILGLISWKLRTQRLPAEVFRVHDTVRRITVGRPISVEEQQKHQQSPEEFGRWLKQQTYSLRKWN